MTSPIARPILRLLAAGGIMAMLVTAPSLSQTPNNEERVELIMGGLPAAGSPEYKALLKHAGNAKGQVLPLTRCEMWSVPRSRLAALQRAAKEKNISVKVLDATWNEVFTPMPASVPMEGTVKDMHAMAMQSPATGAVGVMSTRTASMVEYALTKGMSDKDAAKQPMSIKIALNERTTVTAVRKSVVISGDRCTWRGVVEGTTQPVTIMWWGSGRVTGTIHYGDRVYQLKQFGPDMIGVVESMVDRMPDEHPKTSPKRMQDMQLREDTPYTQGDSSAMRPRPKRSEVDDAKDSRDGGTPKGVRTAVVGPGPTDTGSRKETARPKPGKAPHVTIDVMVVYTAKAAAHYSDIRRDLIELAIEETNQSFRASRIDNASVRLVHTHKTDYAEAGGEHFDHVWRMVDRDGFMEEIPRLRNEKKADVVILVVDDPSGCGLATRVAADAEEAYAVVHHECAATSYSVAHEIGHIIGTRHDRSLDQNTTPYPHGHGYISPDLKWRTMMSYKSGCSGCPRLPIWSTPDKVVDGGPAGDPLHNNAAVIRDHAARVAAFR